MQKNMSILSMVPLSSIILMVNQLENRPQHAERQGRGAPAVGLGGAWELKGLLYFCTAAKNNPRMALKPSYVAKIELISEKGQMTSACI